MFAADKWKDYELIDAAGGERLERWGKYLLIRPDPQVLWSSDKDAAGWRCADAVYKRSSKGGGEWSKNDLPEKWTVSYGKLKFVLRPMGFKHTGLFPEQAANWDWFSELIRSAEKPVSVLNLFAYTGGATIAAAAVGASVCHVDASRGMVAQAKENAALSGLEKAPIRYIVDDCKKFVEREIRRGSKYDAVIMDPPSYGRGPSGEIWKIEDSIDGFVSLCAEVLTDKPLFVLINSYTTGLSPLAVKYILDLRVGSRHGGFTTAEELTLPVSTTGGFLPCGASARWTAGRQKSK